MLRDELEDALAGVRQLLGRRATVGSPGDRSRLDLLTQTGDADLEELIEVAGEDRRNFTRSRSGFRASRASYRTRALNSSQDSSRFRYGNWGASRLATRRGRAPTVVAAGGPGSTAAMSSGRLLCCGLAGEDSTAR